MADIPWAVREGAISIGGVSIPCAVLETGERVLTQQGVLKALGRSRTAKGGEGASVDMGPAFMRAKNLKPFISKELLTSTKAIEFKPLKGGYTPKGSAVAIAYGFKADAFPDILKVYVDAAKAGVLQWRQEKIAELAKRLLAALPKVGMIALVDEATGYQQDRPHDDLQRILEAYVLPEHRPWMRSVPREFTKELYRVYGWNTATQRGPRYAGKLTRKLLYENLPAPVLPELDKLNPPVSRGNKWQRGRKHHSHLTKEIGLEHFKAQLSGVMALLRASPNKSVFERLFQRAYGAQEKVEYGTLPLFPDLPDGQEVEIEELDEKTRQ
jgi:hypothetical protein